MVVTRSWARNAKLGTLTEGFTATIRQVSTFPGIENCSIGSYWYLPAMPIGSTRVARDPGVLS